MFVYKKNPVGIELFSHVKTLFYSKQFAKLLTRWLKTICSILVVTISRIPDRKVKKSRFPLRYYTLPDPERRHIFENDGLPWLF